MYLYELVKNVIYIQRAFSFFKKPCNLRCFSHFFIRESTVLYCAVHVMFFGKSATVRIFHTIHLSLSLFYVLPFIPRGLERSQNCLFFLFLLLPLGVQEAKNTEQNRKKKFS